MWLFGFAPFFLWFLAPLYILVTRHDGMSVKNVNPNYYKFILFF